MSDALETPQETAPQEAELGRVSAPADLAPADEAIALSEASVESSTPFVGRWNELVSTTNWEKGRIISDWREALVKADAPVTDYSDEAWARLVGGVTSQHVGRLRRAHERFGEICSQYPGLYWSHFQAALDWDDAEMWLEGAVTKKWSVSQMRASRWEAVGGPGEEQPQVVETQIDEDSYQALVEGAVEGAAEGASAEASTMAVESGGVNSPEPTAAAEGDDHRPAPETPSEQAVESAPRVQPFKDIAALPDDVAEAFEQFKLVILSHKMTGWEQIGRDDLLGVLESLKTLAVAPSADEDA